MNDIVDLESFRKKRKEQEVSNFDTILDNYENEEEMFHEFATYETLDFVDYAREIDINIEDNPEAIRDIIIIVEAMKGFLARMRGKKHHMHQFADSITDDLDVKLALEIFLSYYDEDED